MSAAAAPSPSAGLTARFQHRLSDFSIDVSLSLPARGVTAVFGASGCGKTSLLRCMAGLERASNAYLRVDGQVWHDTEGRVFWPVHRRPLGFVFQDAALFAHLNVQRNLAFGLRRVPASAQRVSLDDTIALLGIEGLLGRMPATLSGGERQRVAIARALATSPRLLLMDEPLAALDAQRKAEVLPYLDRLQRELDIPVVYVTHAPDEVARLADHLVLMDAGRVTAQGPTRALLTRLDLPLAQGDAAAALIDAEVVAVERGYHLAHAAFAGGRLSLVNPSLRLGQRIRVRVQARDVSITLAPQAGTSVQNIVAVTVVDVVADAPGQVMVALNAGGTVLLARITRKSADLLQLACGQRVFAQVKGVVVVA